MLASQAVIRAHTLHASQARLAHRRLVLNEQAPVRDHVDARRRDGRLKRRVADARLQPHGARPRGDDVGQVLREIGRAAEHVHDVDLGAWRVCVGGSVV